MPPAHLDDITAVRARIFIPRHAAPDNRPSWLAHEAVRLRHELASHRASTPQPDSWRKLVRDSLLTLVWGLIVFLSLAIALSTIDYLLK